MREPIIRRKSVTITKSDFVEKNKTTKFSKFQLWIAKKIKLPVNHKFNFMYKIWYNGRSRLKKDMLVVSSCGIRFLVIDEKSKMAVLSTVDDGFTKPVLNGLLTIIDYAQEEKYAKDLDEYIKSVEKKEKQKEKSNLKIVE